MDKKIALSWGISILLVVIIIAFFDIQKVVHTLSEFDPLIFFGIIGLNAISFLFRAATWKIILEPIKKISFMDSFHIINVSFFANVVLPLRIGDLARAFLLSKFYSIPKSVAFSTVILNRVIEALVLVAMFFIGAGLISFLGPEIFGFVFVVGIAMVLSLAPFFFPRLFSSGLSMIGVKNFIPKKIWEIGKNSISAGKSLKASAKNNLLMVFFTAIVWLLHLAACFLAAFALGIPLGIGELLVVVSFVSLSALVPSSPGFIGTFQAAFIGIFIALGQNPEAGLGMSIVLHLASIISIVVLGFYSTKKLSISIHGLFDKTKGQKEAG